MIWDDPNLVKLQNCKQISFNENNYIIKAYLNLKLIDLNINNEKKHNCREYLDNKKFVIVYGKKISIVTPVYNEESNIKSFLDRLLLTLKKINTDYEIIFFLDPSSDNTEKNFDGTNQK